MKKKRRYYPGDGGHILFEFDLDGKTGKVLKFERRVLDKGIIPPKPRKKKKP